MQYEYDFGGSWLHNIVLEKNKPVAKDRVYPHCIKGKRACPLEDCGGIYGYMNLVEVFTDKNHPEHKNAVEWYGKNLNPEAFGLEPVNES